MTLAGPVGEDSWIDFVEQKRRTAPQGLEAQVEVIEQFRRAVQAEPYSLRVWTTYCEYFWSLYAACHSTNAAWPADELQVGRELFSLDAALNLWQEGYEAVRYRLGDSHELWNRWINLELEQLAKTRTEPGVKRVTHLFKARLATPHSTWDETSQMFSSFLSEYNKDAYELEMQNVSSHAAEAKKLYAPRDRYELKLDVAKREGDVDKYKAALQEYLDWEIQQANREIADGLSTEGATTNVKICLGLLGRALTGALVLDEATWTEYVVFLSSQPQASRSEHDVLPNMLDVLQRGVQHCPWSGTLWARYILSAEQAGLSFSDIERIKHAATGSGQLDRDGMMGVLEMYNAWCGYLKRNAMDPHALEEAVDVADVGLIAAIEDVRHWGKRQYGDAYQGDPKFCLEKLYIQYLTEKHGATELARQQWETLAKIDLHANSYDFWLHYYLWEMLVFQAEKARSPTPSTLAQGLRVPTLATEIFGRALKQRNIDWPERIMEVYLQHCNDYQVPQTLIEAMNTIYTVRKAIAKRREREAIEAQALQQEETTGAANHADAESSSAKRKREISEAQGDGANKRAKNSDSNAGGASLADQELQTEKAKRDRENTSVMVTGLPTGVTMTKVRQYFREYGHIKNITVKTGDGGRLSAAFVEFDSNEEAESALLRDGKFFGQQQISVKPANDLTLYVTNFPPQADDKYIRDLFKECGEIISIRWPSLSYNPRRRFCYVTFQDLMESAKAEALDGKLLEGKFKLVAKYSDPSRKKAREGAIEEGRELHVQNFGFEATEEDLQEIFGRYGRVASVRILRNMAGRSRGTGFVVFDSKEVAETAARELDKTKYRHQLLAVTISKPAATKLAVRSTAHGALSPSPASTPKDSKGDAEGDEDMAEAGQEVTERNNRGSAKEIAERTIAVLGIPDTVNDTRVRALLEPYGKISRMTLYPSRGGAMVEFAAAAEAGKAALAIVGLTLDDAPLRVGTTSELFHEKGMVRVDRIDAPSAGKKGDSKGKEAPSSANNLRPPAFAPAHFRRPLGGGSGSGPKRGLGFTGAMAKSAALSAARNKNGAAAEPAAAQSGQGKKSNADFKALFLSGGAKGAKADKTDEKSNAETNGHAGQSPESA